MTTQYTAVIIKSNGWYAGTVKELSGVHTQGKTIEEVRENLKEAIQMVVESNVRHFVSEGESVIEEEITVEV